MVNSGQKTNWKSERHNSDHPRQHNGNDNNDSPGHGNRYQQTHNTAQDTTTPRDHNSPISEHGTTHQSACERVEKDFEAKQHQRALCATSDPNNTRNSCSKGSGTTPEDILCNSTTTSNQSGSLPSQGWENGKAGRLNHHQHCAEPMSNVTIRKDIDNAEVAGEDYTGQYSIGQCHVTNADQGRIGKDQVIHATRLIPKFRHATIRLLTININGYTAAKSVRIRQILEKHQCKLAIITETQQRLHSQLVGQGIPLSVIGEGSPSTGIALVYPTATDYRITYQSERIIQLTTPNNTHIIGLYGPNETQNAKVKLDFYAKLDNVITQAIAQYATVIVIGDMNAGQEPLKCKKPNCGPNYPRLNDIITKHNLECLETGPTWISNRTKQPERTLDRCMVYHKGRYRANATLDFQDRIADHAILVAHIDLDDISRNVGRSRGPHSTTSTYMDCLWEKTKRPYKACHPSKSRHHLT